MADLVELLQQSYGRAVGYIRAIDVVQLLISLGLALAATLLVFLLLRLLRSVMTGLRERAGTWVGRRWGPIRFQRQELLPAEDVARVAGGIIRVAHIVIALLLVYLYLSLVLGLFPLTRELAAILVGAVIGALELAITQTIGYIPSLAIIAVVVVGTHLVVRLAAIIFAGVEKGRIRISGFYPEWAGPTFGILRLLVYALAIVVVFPYLPGSGSPAFQGVSIFVGLLLSLGSTSAVANVVAGVVITYMRAFRVGDRVQIAETVGDVVERSMLVTKLRTTKNVVATIPNSAVLANHIINYSGFAREQGLILHTTVTIGYDVPWRRVHELLLGAAAATEGLEAEPEPFVLQTSLDDFYVSYELNGYTHDAREMPAIYSRLHAGIQDRFNEAGVEIMSPHYGALRDGNETAIPSEHRRAGHRAPGFRLHPLDKILNPDETSS